MQKWEYLTTLLQADAEQQLSWPQQQYPNAKRFAKFVPAALTPHLNKLGDDGWELVSCELVKVGDNQDLLIAVQYAAMNIWSHTYLCVFKRPKQ